MPKSQVAREAVARYLAPAESRPGTPSLTASDMAARWPSVPRLTPDEANAFAAGVRARRSAFVEAVLGLLPVLPFGLPEARRHAELWAELARRGSLIGPHDLIIGATALALGHRLATLNARELARVPGLRLVSLDPFLA